MKDSYIFYKDKLNAEYKPVFERVEMYVMTQNIDESTQEERLGELLDIFLSAQDTGKSVQKLVGNNLEQFCKTFCSDFGIKNRIFYILDLYKTVAWVLAVISAFDILALLLDAPGVDDFWHSASDLQLSVYFIAVLIAAAILVITNIVFRRLMFKTKRVSMRVLKITTCIEAGISSGAIVLILICFNAGGPGTPIWIVALVSCIYLLLYYLLCGKRIKRHKVSVFELAGEDIQKELGGVMEKRFEKAKKKNLKKGKGELTMEEFLDREEQSCNRAENVKFFYIILPIGVTALSCIITYMNEGFATSADLIFYIILMLAVEYVTLLGLWKIVKGGIKTRRTWLEAKRKEKE